MESFMYGQSSALVDIAAVLGAFAVTFSHHFTLCFFAAGAMILVVEEVIPETQQDNNTDIANDGFGDLLL
jgi:ZIP family zinc transporter